MRIIVNFPRAMELFQMLIPGFEIHSPERSLELFYHSLEFFRLLDRNLIVESSIGHSTIDQIQAMQEMLTGGFQLPGQKFSLSLAKSITLFLLLMKVISPGWWFVRVNFNSEGLFQIIARRMTPADVGRFHSRGVTIGALMIQDDARKLMFYCLTHLLITTANGIFSDRALPVSGHINDVLFEAMSSSTPLAGLSPGSCATNVRLIFQMHRIYKGL